jgi:hypothetical protein
MKLVRLIKMSLIENYSYSSVRVGRHLSDMFGRCFNGIALQLCFRICH